MAHVTRRHRASEVLLLDIRLLIRPAADLQQMRDHCSGSVVVKKSRLTFVQPLAWMTGVWLVAAGVFFRNFLLTGFDKIIGDAGDARLDIFLRENLHQFLRGRAELLSPPMFFPMKGTLGYSDAYLLDGLIYVPLRIMGLDPFLSFELLCIGLSLIGFVSANILLMRFAGVRQPLAALAAAIFVFSNALYISMGHPQLYEINFIPLVAILLLEAARLKTIHPIGAAVAGSLGGLVLGLLFSTGYYVAWYFTFLSGIVLVLATVLRFGLWPVSVLRGRLYLSLVRRYSRIGTAAAVGFAVGVVLFWKIYAPVIAQFPSRPFNEYLDNAPTVRDLLNVGGDNLLWGRAIELLHIVARNHLFSGEFVLAITPILFVTFLICAWAVWRNRLLSGPEDRFLRNAIFALVFAVASMTVVMVKVGEFSLFWFVWHLVPGANALRAGGRVQIVMNGFVVAVVAIVLARCMQTTSSSRVRFAIWALALLCVVEQVNVVSNHNLSRAEETASLRTVPVPLADCKSFYVLSHTPKRGATIQQINGMLIAQRINLPTLNGYSGWSPPDWDLYEPEVSSYQAKAWLWAASHGVDDGLCQYDVARRRWLPVREDAALQMAGAILQPGTSIDFGAGASSDVYRLRGWSRPETSGTWTDGPMAVLAADAAHWRGADMLLEVTARPFLVRDKHSSLQVDIEVNGSLIDRWSYSYDQDNGFVVRTARVPVSLFAGAPLLKLGFRIREPASPKMLGIHATDNRDLGLFFTRASFNVVSSDGGSEGQR
jgi:hypothetical protein